MFSIFLLVVTGVIFLTIIFCINLLMVRFGSKFLSLNQNLFNLIRSRIHNTWSTTLYFCTDIDFIMFWYEVFYFSFFLFVTVLCYVRRLTESLIACGRCTDPWHTRTFGPSFPCCSGIRIFPDILIFYDYNAVTVQYQPGLWIIFCGSGSSCLFLMWIRIRRLYLMRIRIKLKELCKKITLWRACSKLKKTMELVKIYLIILPISLQFFVIF